MTVFRLSMIPLLSLGLLLQGCTKSVIRTNNNSSDYHENNVSRPPSSDSGVASKSSRSQAAEAMPRSSSGIARRPTVRSAPRPNARRAYRSYRSRRYQRRARSYYRRKSRPGLGTSYGESLYAPVQNVSFERGRSYPNAVLRVNYNSPSGVYAMARYLGGVSCCRTNVYSYRGGVSVRLTNRYGRRLRGLNSRGRVWYMGRHGHRYNIQVRNHTNRRKEVVISVDGLDVIDGKRAHYNKRGYILMPYATLNVNGFRRSYRHVAAFRFSKVKNSYAARTSGSRNVGVIGVAVFNERPSRWNRRELNRRLYASPFATPPRY